MAFNQRVAYTYLGSIRPSVRLLENHVLIEILFADAIAKRPLDTLTL